MAHTVPPAPKITPATATTARGLATASFALSFWGLVVFWWYPFGMTVASVGVLLGIITLALGIRAGKDGENLALLGIFCGSASISFAIGAYRFAQLAFEGSIPAPDIFPDIVERVVTYVGIGVAVVGVTAGLFTYAIRIPSNRAVVTPPTDSHAHTH